MRIKKDFFEKDTNELAKELLGKKIIRILENGKRIEAIITETESYHGFDDKASHASRKKTERNKIMFDEAGLVYVYLIYGMHWCLNFTTMPKDFPAAVLIRGVYPTHPTNLSSVALAEEDPTPLTNLAPINGPGETCKFLEIDKTFYGENLFKSKRFWLEDGIEINKNDIIAGKRIGVNYAEECAEWLCNYKIIISNE